MDGIEISGVLRTQDDNSNATSYPDSSYFMATNIEMSAGQRVRVRNDYLTGNITMQTGGYFEGRLLRKT